MFNSGLMDEFSHKLAGLLASSPAQDLEKNARALLGSLLTRLDVVPREEFEVQRARLLQLEQQLAALETRLSELETRR